MIRQRIVRSISAVTFAANPRITQPNDADSRIRPTCRRSAFRRKSQRKKTVRATMAVICRMRFTRDAS